MRALRIAAIHIILYIPQVIYGASIPDQGTEHLRTWTSNETANWTEADLSCRTKGGQLLYDVPSLGIPFPETIGQLQDKEEVWIGARAVSTPWIWENTNVPLYTHLGYSPDSGIKVERHLVSHDNQVFTCSAFCSTYYIALKESFCGCLYGEPSEIRNATSMLGDCPGNHEERCGNATGYDIYMDGLLASYGSKLPKFRVNGNNTYQFTLAYLSVSEDSSTSIVTSNSPVERRGALCDLDGGQDGSHLTREEAVKACKGKGLYTVRAGHNLPVLRPGNYWIGLKRSYAWRWINGEAVDITKWPVRNQGGQCVGLSKTQEKTTLQTFKCSQKQKYSCLTRRSTVLGVSLGPSPAPKKDTAKDWRIWLAVGIGVGVAVVLAPVVLCAVIRRRRVSRDDKKKDDNPQPASDQIEAEYSDVHDVMIGGVISLPDVVTDEGVYSEPCVDDGHFRRQDNIPKTLKMVKSPEIHKMLQEDHYDNPIRDNSGYVTPFSPPESIYNETTDPLYSSTNATASQYATPRLEGPSSNMTAGRKESPKVSSKWEPGRYDVPRNKDGSVTRVATGVTVIALQTDTTNEADDESCSYAVPVNKHNIYAKPMK